jgi:hypothetical protein
MDNQVSKIPNPQSDITSSRDYERGLKVLGRIIARRHMRIQLNKIKRDDDENTNKHDNNNSTSKA